MLRRADYLLCKLKASLMVIEQRRNVCYKVYTSMLELGMHLEYPYYCNLCVKHFTILGHLKNHEKHHILKLKSARIGQHIVRHIKLRMHCHTNKHNDLATLQQR